MSQTRRSVKYLLIAIALLFLFFCLYACAESDFYDRYGESQDGSSAPIASDAHASDDAGQMIEESPSDGTDGEETFDPQVSPVGDTDETDATGTTDGETPTDEPTAPEQTPTDEPTAPEQTPSDDPSDGDPVLPSGDTDEKEGEDAMIFDPFIEMEGLYRLIQSDAVVDEPVYVGMSRIGKASVSEVGDILFDCGFLQAQRELWGNYDEKGHLILYVRFEELDGVFRRMVFSSFAEVIQLDLTEEELAALSGRETGKETEEVVDLVGEGSKETNAPQTDEPIVPQTEEPQGSVGDLKENTPDAGDPSTSDPGLTAPEEIGQTSGQGEADPQGSFDPVIHDTEKGEEEPQSSVESPEASGESLPMNSAAYSLWQGIGVPKNVSVVVLTEEEEEYGFLLTGTASERAELMTRLSPYLFYADETTSPCRYQFFVTQGQMQYNINLLVLGNESMFLAEIKVIGEAL